MSRYSFAFVRGVFIGCAVSALLLVATDLVYSGVSLSWDSVYGEAVDSSALAEGRSLLLYSESEPSLSVAVVGDEKVEVEVSTQRTSNEEEEEEEELQDVLQLRKPLLAVVVTSEKLLERTVVRIHRTWGRDTSDYKIVVGGQQPTSSGNPNIFYANHPDFPAFPYLSLEELNFLLNMIRTESMDQYNWLLLMPSNTYLSVQDLKTFLEGLDASKVVYMGYPSNSSVPGSWRYCEGGPGLIFSHTALRLMKGKLEWCIEDSSDRTDSSYRQLGECLFNQLKMECYLGSNVPLEHYFLYDRNMTSLTPEQMWRRSLYQPFLTLHPIRDSQHMDTVHTFVQARSIARRLKRARSLQESVQTHPLCQDTLEDVLCGQYEDILLHYGNYSYENFSRMCNYLRRGYIPEVRRKVTNWDSVVGHTIYNSWELDPQALVHGDLSKELKFMTKAAMELVKRDLPDATLHDVATIFVRYMGSVGREFIFDLVLNATRGQKVGRRIALLLPHHNETFLHTPVALSQAKSLRVNFIVPLNGLDRKRVAKFQRTFYTLCVRKAENCRVVYVIFSSSKTDVNFMQTYLVRFNRRHTKFIYEYVVGKGSFNRTLAYDLGMAKLKDDELALVATVDLSIADHFLGRCRANTVQGKRIYYPEVFTYYNMPYVYRGKWHPRNYDYSRMHGRWATHAVGCIYKSDYTEVGGYSAFKRWELDPSEAPLGGRMELMRAPDPGVSHWYETTRCDSSLPPNQFSRCLSRQSDNLADRLSLAGYLLSLEEKCGDDHKR